MIKWMSSRLIQRTINNKEEIKALSLAFAIKAKYKSSQINDSSYSKLASMFSISRETAKKRIGVLRTMGLIKEDGDNILFLSFKDSWENANIEIQDYSKIDITNLKEIERFLRLQGVYIKQSQIDYAANANEATTTVKSMKELRAAKRRLKKIRHWGGKTDRGQSINTVKKASGLGTNKAVELLQWAEKNKLIEKEVRRVREDSIPLGDEKWKESAKSRKTYFMSHGFVFSVLPSILIFL